MGSVPDDRCRLDAIRSRPHERDAALAEHLNERRPEERRDGLVHLVRGVAGRREELRRAPDARRFVVVVVLHRHAEHFNPVAESFVARAGVAVARQPVARPRFRRLAPSDRQVLGVHEAVLLATGRPQFFVGDHQFQ